MIRPIDMQVIVKNVDEVAKQSKSQATVLTMQQENAEEENQREMERKISTVSETEETKEKIIERDLSERSKNIKKMIRNPRAKKINIKEEQKKKKIKYYGRGRWLDLDS